MTGIGVSGPIVQGAAALQLKVAQVTRAVEWLASGNTVPFIARHRKEDLYQPYRPQRRTKASVARDQMVLEGKVTNVTAFGAFVDLGVQRDGLVHISELAPSFVNDPHSVVSINARVRVKVLAVDVARNRISLSIR